MAEKLCKLQDSLSVERQKLSFCLRENDLLNKIVEQQKQIIDNDKMTLKMYQDKADAELKKIVKNNYKKKLKSVGIGVIFGVIFAKLLMSS